MVSDFDLRKSRYSAKDVASLLQITTRTLSNWERDGMIAFERVNGHRYITRDDLLTYLSENNLYTPPLILLCGSMTEIMDFVNNHSLFGQFRVIDKPTAFAKYVTRRPNKVYVFPKVDKTVKHMIKSLESDGQVDVTWF